MTVWFKVLKISHALVPLLQLMRLVLHEIKMNEGLKLHKIIKPFISKNNLKLYSVLTFYGYHFDVLWFCKYTRQNTSTTLLLHTNWLPHEMTLYGNQMKKYREHHCCLQTTVGKAKLEGEGGKGESTPSLTLVIFQLGKANKVLKYWKMYTTQNLLPCFSVNAAKQGYIVTYLHWWSPNR